MLQQEEARLERMRAKQEREMKAIVEFEKNLVKKKLEHEQKVSKLNKEVESLCFVCLCCSVQKNFERGGR